MEIYKLLIQFFAIVCVGIYSPLVFAKPFSINEALAAKGLSQPKLINTIESAPFKSLNPVSRKPETLTANNEDILPKPKLVSLFKNRLPFKNPFPKPKLLLKKHLSNPVKKRKIQSVKRETQKYHKYGKYLPLFKDIDSLLRDLFYTNTIDSREVDSGESRHENSIRNKTTSDSENVKPCKCNHEPNSTNKKTDSPTATRATEGSKTQNSEITTPGTDHATFSDVSSLRQNTNIPEVPTRNTSRYGRVRNGLHKDSGATHHANVERNLTRDNRDSEYDSGGETDRTDAEDYEENTDNTTRDGTGGGRRVKRLRGNGNNARDSNIAHQIPKNHGTGNEEAFRDVGKNYERYKIKNKNKVKRNEIQYYEYDSTIEGDRFEEFESRYEDNVIPEYEQSDDNHEESGESGDEQVIRLRGRRINARDSNNRYQIRKNNRSDNEEPFRDFRKNYERYKIRNKNKARRNETKHYEYDSTVNGDRFGGLVSGFQNNLIPECEQSEENYGESIIDDKQDNTSHQELFEGNGTSARDTKGNVSANETTFIIPTEKSDTNEAHIIITDGYSLMRYTNGENRTYEKAIPIKS